MAQPAPHRRLDRSDRLLAGLGRVLATLSATPGAALVTPRPAPGSAPDAALTPEERRQAGMLMRVNHVGEVCAQALYEGQAAATADPGLERFFREAAAKEGDHLAWTRERLQSLGARPSVLNPVWYAGAFAFGSLAGMLGDRFSLGFMVETERQVEDHLAGHLQRLPAGDGISRAIVVRMKDDEAEHAASAQALGAAPMPAPLRVAMRLAARMMTETASRI